jgi:hypothetical protein
MVIRPFHNGTPEVLKLNAKMLLVPTRKSFVVIRGLEKNAANTCYLRHLIPTSGVCRGGGDFTVAGHGQPRADRAVPGLRSATPGAEGIRLVVLRKPS